MALRELGGVATLRELLAYTNRSQLSVALADGRIHKPRHNRYCLADLDASMRAVARHPPDPGSDAGAPAMAEVIAVATSRPAPATIPITPRVDRLDTAMTKHPFRQHAVAGRPVRPEPEDQHRKYVDR